METCDVLVIGSGLAAVYTALNLAPSKKVILVTKGLIDECNSTLAQGGIAATIENDEQKIQSHIADTMYAGSNINDKVAVDLLIRNSKAAIAMLMELGVAFDEEDGKLLLTKEGGHHASRILRAGKDITGRKIMDALYQTLASRKNILVMTNTMFTNLIHDANKCLGAYFLNEANESFAILATHTVLATGGIGNLYKYSTNPSVASGDGIAASYRAMVTIENMEFVQFHPTAFALGSGNQKFLISETLRGEGGIIRNIEKKTFMPKYHKMGDLAPRDVVSQSIFKEMYDTWSDHVYLDMTHLDKNFVINRFPNIYQNCKSYNIDITTDLIPITPVEHFMVGGIKTDTMGRTSMTNLYAVGECASTGVHGANRLASNSLLECVVFGNAVADFINNSLDIITIVPIECPKAQPNQFNFGKIKTEVRELMFQNLGVIREKSKMEYTEKVLLQILADLAKANINTKNYYKTLNLVTTAYLITKASLNRPLSLGCHYVLED